MGSFLSIVLDITTYSSAMAYLPGLSGAIKV